MKLNDHTKSYLQVGNSEIQIIHELQSYDTGTLACLILITYQ